MRLVHDSEHWLVVDKEAGWLTVPGREGANDPRPCLGVELQKTYGRLWPVHRLDFAVSGLVLFARDADAHRRANAWFEKRIVKKRYVAVSELASGVAFESGREMRWESQIVRGKKRSFVAPHGQDAVTLAVFRGAPAADPSLGVWDLSPLTGRPHQLRVELARNAGPIVGDELYGSKREWKAGGIALRAVRLDFTSIPPADRLGLPDKIQIEGFEGYL